MTILVILLIIGSLILSSIIILDKFVNNLPESSRFKKWWQENIIGYENK